MNGHMVLLAILIVLTTGIVFLVTGVIGIIK